MKIRVLWNVLLVRLNIREVLAVDVIRKTGIRENNEVMILLPRKKMIVSNKNVDIYGRKSVVEKLTAINRKLEGQGYQLCIFDLYRDENTQKNRRLKEYENLKKEYPGYDETVLNRILDKRVVNIKKNYAGGHQTGGAVDLTICTEDGRELDMGTKYLEFNEKTKTRSGKLSKEQAGNRKRLLELMEKEDFVNYPGEWWHFSYGDAAWAAYKNNSSIWTVC
ncbi:MAG: hypothetical protein LBJ60_08010, partial [Tannerellaceae bacterium]|nr:hypothetical protein [Tannerellaceae bacterium]